MAAPVPKLTEKLPRYTCGAERSVTPSVAAAYTMPVFELIDSEEETPAEAARCGREKQSVVLVPEAVLFCVMAMAEVQEGVCALPPLM